MTHELTAALVLLLLGPSIAWDFRNQSSLRLLVIHARVPQPPSVGPGGTAANGANSWPQGVDILLGNHREELWHGAKMRQAITSPTINCLSGHTPARGPGHDPKEVKKLTQVLEVKTNVTFLFWSAQHIVCFNFFFFKYWVNLRIEQS